MSSGWGHRRVNRVGYKERFIGVTGNTSCSDLHRFATRCSGLRLATDNKSRSAKTIVLASLAVTMRNGRDPVTRRYKINFNSD
jgi:hypothetical protein